MFESLSLLTDEQVRLGAEALHRGDDLAIKIDPSDIYAVISPDKKKIGEMDFACLRKVDDLWEPMPLNPSQYTVVHAWTHDAWRRIGAVWGQLRRDDEEEEG